MNSLSAALLLILCLVLCHGNNVVDILKPSQSSAVTPNPALGISTAFVLNYGVHPESLKNITATLQDLQIPFEVLSAIPFKHDLAKPKELIEPPPAHCFHNRTKMQIERVTSIVKKRKEFTWEKVSEWQTQLQLFFRLATVLRQAQVRKEQLQPFLILDDEAVLTPEIIDMLKPSFLHEELPNDWQLVVLDALHYTCLKKATAKYCRVQAVLKLSGYIIRDMHALLALINTFNTPFPRLFDAFVSRILAEEMVIGYCVNRR